MSQRSGRSSFADFFPTAPSVLQEKKKAAKDRRKSHTETPPSTKEVDTSATGDEQHVLDNHDARQRKSVSYPNGTDHNEKLSPPQDAGDLLNGVGSASSLTSTSSSVFSQSTTAKQPQNALDGQFNSLTPLTNHESSPPQPLYSPQQNSNIASSSHVNDLQDSKQPPRIAQSNTSNSSRAQLLAKVFPPLGESRGQKILYNPDLDPKVPQEHKKKVKPKYKPIGGGEVCQT